MKTCPKCQSQFEIAQKDLAFYEKISPVFNNKKFQISPPALCPECRQQRRLCFRNERKLYHSQCNLCGQKIISMFPENSSYKVYCQNCFWSDKFDALDYGQKFDSNKSFCDQFLTLIKNVPRCNLYNRTAENSDYSNYNPHSKNCYLIFASWFNEDCYYGRKILNCKNCLDNLILFDSELCYENVCCDSNYNSSFCVNCKKISNSYFCFDCSNIQNCIACWNLKNKKYHIFNKPVSKEKFEEEKSKLGYDNYASKLKKKFLELIKTKAIHRGFPGFDNENVSGDHIFHSQNIGNGFLIFDSRELTYAFEVSKQQDSYDIEGCSQGELIYESFGNDFAYRSIGCITCEYLNDSYYCDYCFNSQNLFASIGLRHKQYCILNKQYSKQEYEELVPKIIEHMQKTPLHQDYAGQAGEWPASRSFSEGWGEFFDPRVSPFGYNETVAQEYFPLTKKQAQEQGFNWSDYEAPFPKVEKIIKADELDRDQKFLIPENNDILNYAIECEITHKPFRIIKQELDFYRKHNLPLPKRHPDQRHKDRLSLRNPRKLWNRACNKCNIPIQTSYSPDRPETVYCEKCYLETVY